MTEQELNKLKELFSKSTPGEWTAQHGAIVCKNGDLVFDSSSFYYMASKEDLDFISTIHNQVPVLLEHIITLTDKCEHFTENSLQAEIETLRESLAAMPCACPGETGICAKCLYFTKRNGTDVG